MRRDPKTTRKFWRAPWRPACPKSVSENPGLESRLQALSLPTSFDGGFGEDIPILLSFNLLAGCEDFLPLPTSRTCLTPAMAAPCSADLQSALSPNCIRPSVVQL